MIASREKGVHLNKFGFILLNSRQDSELFVGGGLVHIFS